MRSVMLTTWPSLQWNNEKCLNYFFVIYMVMNLEIYLHSLAIISINWQVCVVPLNMFASHMIIKDHVVFHPKHANHWANSHTTEQIPVTKFPQQLQLRELNQHLDIYIYSGAQINKYDTEKNHSIIIIS